MKIFYRLHCCVCGTLIPNLPITDPIIASDAAYAHYNFMGIDHTVVVMPSLKPDEGGESKEVEAVPSKNKWTEFLGGA